MLGAPAPLAVARELLRLRLRRAARIAATRWAGAAAGGGLAGVVAGAAGGLILAAAPGSAATVAIAPVLAVIGGVCGALGGGGVGASLSVAEAAGRPHQPRLSPFAPRLTDISRNPHRRVMTPAGCSGDPDAHAGRIGRCARRAPRLGGTRARGNPPLRRDPPRDRARDGVRVKDQRAEDVEGTCQRVGPRPYSRWASWPSACSSRQSWGCLRT